MADLKRLETYTPFQLTQLPNGDLWRGFVHVDADPTQTADSDTPVVLDPELNDAMEAIVKSSKGPELTCLWCGYQCSHREYDTMQAHVQKQHKDAGKKPTNDMALAQLIAERRLKPADSE